MAKIRILLVELFAVIKQKQPIDLKLQIRRPIWRLMPRQAVNE